MNKLIFLVPVLFLSACGGKDHIITKTETIILKPAENLLECKKPDEPIELNTQKDVARAFILTEQELDTCIINMEKLKEFFNDSEKILDNKDKKS